MVNDKDKDEKRREEEKKRIESKKKSTERRVNDLPPNKKNINRHIYYDDDDDDIIITRPPSPIIPNIIEIPAPDAEYVVIDREINNLTDLIELGKMYDPTANKIYSIDLRILSKLVEPLTELNNMIGMNTVKQEIVDHILFKIQDFDTNNDMMHTVIQGPPGTGKTEVAKIIGKVYLAMGILKNETFVKASRSQLIAGYLGQTARATQRIIDSAQGGILFIDEVYSLGNPEQRDSFSKECIDTINENLTEKKTDFICIIAGYKKEIDTCFFAYNPGLERRFPVRFTIDPYNFTDLYLIFKKKAETIGWELDNTITAKFFEKHYEIFKFFGGDMELLFNRCKRSHSRRVFATKDSKKKLLTLNDLQKGFEAFKNHRETKAKKEKDNELWKTMFM